MININNWDDIQEQQPGQFDRPSPGGYIARIVNVEDREDKEYLRIEWDFAEGEYKGNNAETFNRAGFWPIALIRSYKPKALGFFKAFKTSVEASNRGYVFKNDPPSLVGKALGVVLGEEEYVKGNGEIGKRLYVYQVRSVKAIQDGNFDIPELKRLSAKQPPAPKPDERFQPADAPDDDEDLPF